jgi:hypothetical protein
MENPTNTNNKPNIVLITVDQMRFPMHLPPRKLSDPADKLTINEFLDKYMHQLYTHLWQPGVKFSDLFDADLDKLPARRTNAACVAKGVSNYRASDARGRL